MWYDVLVVCYDVTVWWMCYMAKFAWWYGMFQYIRSVRVEYVVRISSVTTFHANYWIIFETVRHSDRHIYEYQNRDSILQTGTSARCSPDHDACLFGPTSKSSGEVRVGRDGRQEGGSARRLRLTFNDWVGLTNPQSVISCKSSSNAGARGP